MKPPHLGKACPYAQPLTSNMTQFQCRLFKSPFANSPHCSLKSQQQLGLQSASPACYSDYSNPTCLPNLAQQAWGGMVHQDSLNFQLPKSKINADL